MEENVPSKAVKIIQSYTEINQSKGWEKNMTKRRLSFKRVIFVMIISLILSLLIEAVINDSLQAKTLQTEQVGAISSLLEKSELTYSDYDDGYYSEAKAFDHVYKKNELVCLDFENTQIGSVAIEFDSPLTADSLVVLNWNKNPVSDYMKNEKDEEADELPDEEHPENEYSPYKTTRLWADAGSQKFVFSLPDGQYTHLDFFIKENYSLKDVTYSTEPLRVTSRAYNWLDVLLAFFAVTAFLLLICFIFPAAANHVFCSVKKHVTHIYSLRKSILRWFLIIAGCIGITALYEFADYLSNDCFSLQRSVLCFSLLMITSILWFNRYHFVENVDKIMLGLILSLGFMMAGTCPNSNICFDGDVHYRRALKSSYFFSDTAVITQADAFYIDCGEVYIDSESDNDYYPLVNYRVTSTSKNLEEGRKLLNQAYKSGNYYLTDSMHHIMGIAYLPYSFLIFLCRSLKLPFTVTYLISKCGNLLIYAFAMYFACKRLSSRKLLFAVFALLPMHIFMAGNYSYDAFITGLASLGFVYMFEEIRKPDVPLSNRNAVIIYLTIIIGILPKPIYFPLLFILYFFPKTKFRSEKHRKAILCCTTVMILMIIALLGVTMGGAIEGAAGSKGGDIHDYANAGISPIEQMKYVLTHPISYIVIWFRHIIYFFSPSQLQKIFGDWKTLGLLPPANCTISVLLVVLTAMIEMNDNILLSLTSKNRTAVKSTLILSIVFSALLICTALYCGDTPVGSKAINGVQPRYYIPLMFPLTCAVTNTGIIKTTKKPVFEIILITGAVLNTVMSINDMIISNIL